MKISIIRLPLFYWPFFLTLSCSENNDETGKLKVGDSYLGGIVFYILQPGDPNYIEGETHGFVAGDDIEGTFIWGCQTGAVLGWQLGDGENNTSLIASSCVGENAASVCKDRGWYLPNVEEMEQMFHNKLVINSTSSDYFWTSNKKDSSYAYAMRFSDGKFSDFYVTNVVHKVKPIRRF